MEGILVGFKHITSRDNAIFKRLKKLADNKRERARTGQTLLEGVHLVETYLKAYGLPNLLVLPEGHSSQEATALMQQLSDVETVMLPTLMFAELTPVQSSTGILVVIDVTEIIAPEEIFFALVLEDIQDPGNLGSMLRTAMGAQVDAVYLSKGCTDAWSPKCLRGGQGAQFYLPVIEGVDIVDVLKTFSGNSYATTLTGASLYEQDLTKPTAFVVGNEGAGLTPAAVEAATHQVSIPMHGALESLNAAAATAICLFERQRQKSY